MASIPTALAQLFDPLEALLADPQVERVQLDSMLHVQRAGEWTRQALPFSVEVLASALAELVPADGVLELPLDAGARLLALAPPVAAEPVLLLQRQARIAAGDGVDLGPAADTLELALRRGLNLLIVGPDARTRRALLATIAERDTRGAVLIDLADLSVDTEPLVRLGGRPLPALLGWAARLGDQRIFLDAPRAGAVALVERLASRGAPVALGVPGRLPTDGIAWLCGQAEQASAAAVGAGVDVIIAADAGGVLAVDAVEARPEGPRHVPLHLALPSGRLTEERGHADWVARWQRVAPLPLAARSLPPESLSSALRIARAQAAEPALPITTVPGTEGGSTADGSADPLQALLEQLGEAQLEEDVDLDLSEEDEEEETMVQVEGVTSQADRRTFSEILRSLDDTPAASIHVRRGDRITQVREED